MEKRKTKVIIRDRCPETNSSSSHSFVLAKESFKPSDLKAHTQTLIPEYDDITGKDNVIIIDGYYASYESRKKVNDSRSKAYYMIAACNYVFGKTRAKESIQKIKDTIKKNTGAEVITRNLNNLEIDHQSCRNLDILLKSGDPDIYQEFIFNPRVWLYLLWDSENYDDNQIYSSSPDYFKYEISTKLPIKVERFLEEPSIDIIDFSFLSINYPDYSVLENYHNEVFKNNGIDNYIESKGYFDISNSKLDYCYVSLSSLCSSTQNSDDCFEFIGFVGHNDRLNLAYLRSSLWDKVFEKLRDLFVNFVFDSHDIKKYPNLKQYVPLNVLTRELTDNHLCNNRYRVTYLLNALSPILTEDTLKGFGISLSDLKLFPIDIYSREDGNVY